MPFTTSRRGLLALIAGLPVFRGALAGGPVPDTFTLAPGEVVGQSWRFRLDQHLERNGALGHRSTAQVTLEIRARAGDGWLARWTPHATRLLDADPRVAPLLAQIQALWDGVPIDLLLDAGGRVAGLADLDSLGAVAHETLERCVTQLTADPAQAELAGTLRAALTPMVLNPSLLSQSLLKEPSILLGAMGHAYRVGEPLEVRARVPSPLGSGEIPVLGRYAVRGIERRTRLADIGWLMVIDRATYARVAGPELAAALARAGIAEGPEMQQRIEQGLAAMDFSDRADFLVDTATGWPRRVRHERRVSAGGMSRVDVVELTRS